ncbi:MAG: hypothetical protein RIR33_227 [Pseudomonadota bacterium]|jgi:hypothetical protein
MEAGFRMVLFQGLRGGPAADKPTANLPATSLVR